MLTESGQLLSSLPSSKLSHARNVAWDTQYPFLFTSLPLRGTGYAYSATSGEIELLPGVIDGFRFETTPPTGPGFVAWSPLWMHLDFDEGLESITTDALPGASIFQTGNLGADGFEIVFQTADGLSSADLQSSDFTITLVPEQTSGLLMGLGLAGLGRRGRRDRASPRVARSWASEA